MSTMDPVIEIEYTKRKPSKAVVMRTIAEYLKQGAKAFTISWGENCIDLNYHDKNQHWYGEGWIKDISGQDIGEELNSIRKQAVEEIRILNLWNT